MKLTYFIRHRTRRRGRTTRIAYLPSWFEDTATSRAPNDNQQTGPSEQERERHTNSSGCRSSAASPTLYQRPPPSITPSISTHDENPNPIDSPSKSSTTITSGGGGSSDGRARKYDECPGLGFGQRRTTRRAALGLGDTTTQ